MSIDDYFSVVKVDQVKRRPAIRVFSTEIENAWSFAPNPLHVLDTWFLSTGTNPPLHLIEWIHGSIVLLTKINVYTYL
jgi:hypothetical protein